ncbi:Folliculin-interacting protein 1 [Eumeta japonica]|uniref:Folliculin-interacting protein 1 n=1 Tax=Eumeta variegata TaxID=151549 RepID=A0A4C1YLD3_EUMVA|nr:Folliculin-interacting protein 1 [Eumeta japonica]
MSISSNGVLKYFFAALYDNKCPLQYKGSTADATLIGEMIFGAVALSYKGISFKIHITDQPSRLMCTKIFSVPCTSRSQTRDSKISSHKCSSISVSSSRDTTNSTKSMNQTDESVSLSFSFDRGDSGFYGDQTPQSSVTSASDYCTRFDFLDEQSSEEDVCSFDVVSLAAVSLAPIVTAAHYFLVCSNLAGRGGLRVAGGAPRPFTTSCTVARLTFTMERSTRSKVWKYFTKTKDPPLAQCVKCPKQIACKGSNTSGLVRHLEHIHKINLKTEPLASISFHTEAEIQESAPKKPKLSSISIQQTLQLTSKMSLGKCGATETRQIVETRLQEFGLDFEHHVVGVTNDGPNVMKKFGCEIKSAMPTRDSLVEVESENNSSDSNDSEPNTNTDESDNEMDDTSNTRFQYTAENLTKALKETRTIVKLFRRSPLKNITLQKYVKKEFGRELNLTLDVKTRWNSMLQMTDRFLKLKNAIKKALIDLEMSHLWDDKNVVILEKIYQILQPTKLSVEALSRKDSTLLSSEAIIEILCKQLDSMDNKDLAKTFLKSLESKINERRNVYLISLLHYLHNHDSYHQKKNDYLMSNCSKQALTKYTEDIFNRLFPSSLDLQTDVNLQVGDTATSTPALSTSSFEEQLKKAIEEAGNTEGKQESINTLTKNILRKEFHLYETTGKRTPNLELLYKALLTVKPTSTENERSSRFLESRETEKLEKSETLFSNQSAQTDRQINFQRDVYNIHFVFIFNPSSGCDLIKSNKLVCHQNHHEVLPKHVGRYRCPLPPRPLRAALIDPLSIDPAHSHATPPSRKLSACSDGSWQNHAPARHFSDCQLLDVASCDSQVTEGGVTVTIPNPKDSLFIGVFYEELPTTLKRGQSVGKKTAAPFLGVAPIVLEDKKAVTADCNPYSVELARNEKASDKDLCSRSVGGGRRASSRGRVTASCDGLIGRVTPRIVVFNGCVNAPITRCLRARRSTTY